ncbi:MAG: hypothetical protein WA421_12775 [Nitrososphaeraceae archaeon]
MRTANNSSSSKRNKLLDELLSRVEVYSRKLRIDGTQQHREELDDIEMEHRFAGYRGRRENYECSKMRNM